MKFIRDIITEKVHLSAERAADSPSPEQETDLASEEILPSSSDPSETKIDFEEQTIPSIAERWDTAPADESSVSDDEHSIMKNFVGAESETASKNETFSDEDGLNAREIEGKESPGHCEAQPEYNHDTLDQPEAPSRDPFVLSHPSVEETTHIPAGVEAALSKSQKNGQELDQTNQPEDEFCPLASGVAKQPEPHKTAAKYGMNTLREEGTKVARGVPTENITNRTPSTHNQTSELEPAQTERSGVAALDPENNEHSTPATVSVPAPAVGRSAARAGRVKTRLLGFNPGHAETSDPFDKRASEGSDGRNSQFPVGWLIIVDGHGKGSAFTLFDGVSKIGRGIDQTICLNFGDNSISRENHAVVAYDSESRKFFLGHGGKTNLVRLNNRPVLSTEEIESGNTMRIGETTLRFIGLCGSDFQWQENLREEA